VEIALVLVSSYIQMLARFWDAVTLSLTKPISKTTYYANISLLDYPIISISVNI
jgi:hypothetical protein